MKNLGKAVMIIVVRVTLLERDFKLLADKLMRGKLDIKLIEGHLNTEISYRTNDLQSFLSALEYAQRELTGRWFVTDQNYMVRNMEAESDLPQLNADLEVCVINAARLDLLRRTRQEGKELEDCTGVEIDIANQGPKYIKYSRKGLYLRM